MSSRSSDTPSELSDWCSSRAALGERLRGGRRVGGDAREQAVGGLAEVDADLAELLRLQRDPRLGEPWRAAISIVARTASIVRCRSIPEAAGAAGAAAEGASASAEATAGGSVSVLGPVATAPAGLGEVGALAACAADGASPERPRPSSEPPRPSSEPLWPPPCADAPPPGAVAGANPAGEATGAVAGALDGAVPAAAAEIVATVAGWAGACPPCSAGSTPCVVASCGCAGVPDAVGAPAAPASLAGGA